MNAIPTSTDAERAAFVKDIARTAVALGVIDAHPSLRQRGALEREHRRASAAQYTHADGTRITVVNQPSYRSLAPGEFAGRIGPPPTKLMFPNGLKNAPDSIGQQTTKAEPWFRVEITESGALHAFNTRTWLTPRELVKHARKHGLLLVDEDGSVEWFDPEATTHMKVLVMTSEPTNLRAIDLSWRTR